ncbi:hypothetical protein HLRTI_003125 [Halorhabdus tiamatea SARL4B]|uniref:Uncharacterized protein n=1 Tax=Halorhabdus tiamatea SARL4B TaxID=1033806 RepID=F7PQX6_9EURY|nr:hypothetical protein [Halorhabdus tiamatea]ERJ04894.1 hypothetical protein HLRTI_003125 [Halorhabdus tiamatea SARL4B]
MYETDVVTSQFGDPLEALHNVVDIERAALTRVILHGRDPTQPDRFTDQEAGTLFDSEFTETDLVFD